MAEMTITGAVQKVFDRVDIPGNNGTFSKRDIVIRTEEQYPQDISIQFTQDKCDLLEAYKAGESVNISFNLRGQLNGWTNPQGEVKYFTTIQGWKISRNGAQATAPSANTNMPPATPPPAAPGKKYVHLDAAVPEEAYIAAKWNYDQLVSQGKGRWEQAAPAAPGMPYAVPAPNDDLPF